MATPAAAALGKLLESHRDIEERIRAIAASPEDVLSVGQDVLAFASREDEAFSSLTTLIDPDVRAELAAEHRRLAEDLELLEWLMRTSPDSPDVGVLADALVRRMREHLHRDGRLLARAIRM